MTILNQDGGPCEQVIGFIQRNQKNKRLLYLTLFFFKYMSNLNFTSKAVFVLIRDLKTTFLTSFLDLERV